MSIMLLVTLCVVMLLGFPVAFTLSGVAVLFAVIGSLIGEFDIIFYAAIPSRFFGVMSNEILVAVPLFVFMGVMLERSKV
ncbi:MAG TPA: TRAP transporter large permease subunit, partial [Rhodospirillales bacterium]|nr:TRAP transporter large permease subunit [Rhodospirillales bacterium]